MDPLELTPEEQEQLKAMETDENQDETLVEVEALPEDEIEIVEDPADEVEPEKGMVPHAAMHEEREERKKYQAQSEDLTRQLGETRANQDKMQERLDQFMDKLAEPNAEEAKVSYEDDPGEHLRQNQQAQNERMEALEKGQGANQEAATQAQADQNFVNAYRQQAQQWNSEHPDFPDAYKAFRQSKIDEFKTLGYTDVDAGNMATQDERWIAQKAMQDGVNPAERITGIAKMRGYKPAQSEADKIDTIEKGQAQKSLGSNGGAAPRKITLEQLADMDDDDFAAATKGGKWGKFMQA